MGMAIGELGKACIYGKKKAQAFGFGLGHGSGVVPALQYALHEYNIQSAMPLTLSDRLHKGIPTVDGEY